MSLKPVMAFCVTQVNTLSLLELGTRLIYLYIDYSGDDFD